MVDNQIIFTNNIAKLIIEAERLCIGLTFGEAYRTIEQQYLYYYGYGLELVGGEPKTVKGKVRSKTMKSNHLRRLAVDFNFFINGKLTYSDDKVTELGTYWETLHPKNRAGMFWKFKDAPHFEMNVK